MLQALVLAVLLTGMPTSAWERFTDEWKTNYIHLLSKQYFSANPECTSLHIWAEEKGEFTLLYGECTKEL